MNKKVVALVLACVLIFSTVVAGTLAYLTDKTTTVTNTFTFGNVKIALAETSVNNFKLTPGVTYTKDPTVTVEANSENCYVFVKVEKSTNLDNYLTYSIDTTTEGKKWTALDGEDGVYYLEYTSTDTKTTYPVLTNSKVTVKDTISNTDSSAGDQTLAFTAYAVQKDSNIDTPAEAWDIAETL